MRDLLRRSKALDTVLYQVLGKTFRCGGRVDNSEDVVSSLF